MDEPTYDITIERVNASFIKLYVEDKGIRQDISDFFTYQEPGHVKSRFNKWDGIVRLFKLRTGYLPYGCLQMLLVQAKERGWKIDLDTRFSIDITKVTREELKTWITTLDIRSEGHQIEPYDYQIEALYLSIKFNRMVLLAATSAGKSLIAYMLVRYYEMIMESDDEKTLIVVPSQMLVDQMFNDFKDYSSHNGWNVEKNCHTIMQDRPKTSRKPIYISTWQSIHKEAPDYFLDFTSIISDECHLASGKSISSIMDCSVNAHRRIGMTGTLKSDKLHPILVSSLFGPVQRVVTTRQLIDTGRATSVDVTAMMLSYDPSERKKVAGSTYKDEIQFLIEHPHRNKMVASLIASLRGNTLVVFDRIEHIEAVKEILDSMTHGKQVFVITGDVKRDERELIKLIATKEDGITVLGTFGCVSTGLSIKRLRNLVLPHPSKSVVRVLQSLGRILRLHDDKDAAFVFDFMDDLSYEGESNHTLRHAFIRVDMYKNDQLPLSFKKLTMKPTVS